MRFHRLQNVQIALDFLKQRQVRADLGSSRSRAGGFVGLSPGWGLGSVKKQHRPVPGCTRPCGAGAG